nr:MAG TPA: hypothetical protein [Caudoviricetes sp.]
MVLGQIFGWKIARRGFGWFFGSFSWFFLKRRCMDGNDDIF